MPSDDDEVINYTINENEEKEGHDDVITSNLSSSDSEHDDDSFTSSNVVVCQYSQYNQDIF